MKKFNKNLIINGLLIASFLIGMSGPSTAVAATTVSLGTADDFAILAGASIVDTNPSVITGNVGLDPAAGTFIGLTTGEVTGTIYNNSGTGPGVQNAALLTSAKNDLTAAYLNAEGQTPVTTVVASTTDSFSGTGYTLSPGIYKSTSTMGVTGTLTLSGSATDVWIFQAVSSLTTASATNIVLTGGAQACNVFWQVGSSATLGTSTLFKGNVLALTSITDNGGSTVSGRLLARNSTVTLNNTTVTKATCATPPAPPGGSASGSGYLSVVKVVVNDSGGTKTIADFPLFIDGAQVESGISIKFPSSNHVVSETSNSQYTKTFSGDCDANGFVSVASGQNKFCIITNNDIGAPAVPAIPPVIDLLKTASPLSLPAGPGSVMYTYTLSNIGTVPVTNVTIVGDTCSPLVRMSGDSDGDNVLDLTEVWVYTCSTTLTETHTNTAVATGWANGISATDIASATVVVGQPIVPPLIHITKVPNPLALTAVGGLVTYTKKVTNPGIVALSNVTISDDKCSPVNYISGDLNGDAKLDVNETWTYNCRANLYQTTTNTVIVAGQANGLTARDFAIVTVVVAAPSFPNTGLPPNSDFGQLVRAIATNLTKGSRGDNVEALQQFLISQDKGPSAKSLAQVGATAYFGVLTKAALAEFQAKVGISPAYGYFGPITRGYLKANY